MIYDPTYPLFPIFAFLGFVLPLIPLTWHLQAWNSGTCFYMIWASIASLNQFINSIVWAQDAINRAPVWCDISIRISMGASVAIPASSLCIMRRLYNITSSQTVSITRAERRRGVLIDSLICLLFPLIYIAVQYVVQGHRFDIFEGIGCVPAWYNTLPMYFLTLMWPLIIGVVSATYGALSIRAFIMRRIEFSQFLSSSNGITLSRYLRLMLLAATEIMMTIPLGIFVIWLNASASHVEPWISWEDTHFNFSRVKLLPAILWRNNSTLVCGMEMTRWTIPICSLLCFAFFGFAQEARKHYQIAFHAVARVLGVQRPPSPQKDGKLSSPIINKYPHPLLPTSNSHPPPSLSPTTPLPPYTPTRESECNEKYPEKCPYPPHLSLVLDDEKLSEALSGIAGMTRSSLYSLASTRGTTTYAVDRDTIYSDYSQSSDLQVPHPVFYAI